ncbi:MAG: CCA tRNA nucleotidyltransferase [Thermoplasmata archaeon]|nr:CCA tRNA nucleotidyltransferase [Thermoplasmata archaeon]
MTKPTVASNQASQDSIEREVLLRIAPDPTLLVRLAEVREHLVRRASTESNRRGIPLRRALVAGSAARGTFLHERFDIDLFLLFPPDLPRERLETEGLRLAEAILESPEKHYAEHPYLRGRFEGFTVEAVPGYAIEDPSHPLTAVDRTPFHQEYLAAHLAAEQVDQVRLTKQFLRALGVYGSEARTAGFSGYLVELLIVRFGSFAKVLESAESWRLPVRLATPGSRPAVPDDVAMILDDPVDPHRNVATALSAESLARFILAAREYVRTPSVSAFFPIPGVRISIGEAKARVAARGTHVAIVRLPRPSLVDDILYPQLRKTERSVGGEAARLGFEVLGTSSVAGVADLWVALETSTPVLPRVRVQDGPPPGLAHADAFLAKWTAPDAPVLQGPYLRPDGKLAVDVAREEGQLEALLTLALPTMALGRDLREAAKSGVWARPLDALDASPELSELLDRLLNKRLPGLPQRSAGASR